VFQGYLFLHDDNATISAIAPKGACKNGLLWRRVEQSKAQERLFGGSDFSMDIKNL
jgi:hypothetical protein